MSTKVQIANAALDLIGQVQISALTDSTDAARKTSRNIDQAIREVLNQGRWKSARARQTLSELTDPPAFGWLHQYQLPNDFIRLISINDDDPANLNRYRFTIEGKKLLTEEVFIDIVYVADLAAQAADINVAGPLLTELFILNLAIKLCWPFQQSRTLRESLEQEYAAKLRKALALDAREEWVNPINRMGESEWLVRRRFSTNA